MGAGALKTTENLLHMRTLRSSLAIALIAGLLSPAAALAASAPDRGKAFSPSALSSVPLSRPLYGSKPPSEEPDRQQHYVTAHDGVQLYVETWLPEKLGAHTPPKRVPTILVMT